MEGMEVMEESIRTIAEKLKEFHVGIVFKVTGKKKLFSKDGKTKVSCRALVRSWKFVALALSLVWNVSARAPARARRFSSLRARIWWRTSLKVNSVLEREPSQSIYFDFKTLNSILFR